MSDHSDEQSTPEPATDSPALNGSVYLYEQPELLSLRHHSQLGIAHLANRYAFAREVRLVPLVYSEMASAQKHYPVVFSELSNPIPVAVLGAFDDRNLFVDDAGAWATGCYVPSYFRRYPFALAKRSEEQFSMVIDRAAAVVSDQPDLPFFENGEPSESTAQMMEFCQHYDAANQQTRAFCERLQALDLLVEQQVTQQPEKSAADAATEPTPVAHYVAVDTAKLQELSTTVLQELHKAGYLSSIYAHAFSLENWNRILERRATLLAEGSLS